MKNKPIGFHVRYTKGTIASGKCFVKNKINVGSYSCTCCDSFLGIAPFVSSNQSIVYCKDVLLYNMLDDKNYYWYNNKWIKNDPLRFVSDD